MLRAWQYGVQLWRLRRMDETYLQDMLESKGEKDQIADAMANRVLLELRLRHALEPYRALKRYFNIFNWMWRKLHGGYRKSRAAVHGSTNPASGGSPGAGGQPVTQFAYSAPSFAAPTFAGFTASTAPGAGGVIGGLVTKDFEDAGIVAGEVEAFRCWKLGQDGLLRSVVMDDFVWQPGEIVEGDVQAGDGIHGFKSIILAAKYAGSEDGYVTGTIWMWGEVHEHMRGYRASKASIRSIDDSAFYDAPALRKRYGLNKRAKKRPVDKDGNQE